MLNIHYTFVNIKISAYESPQKKISFFLLMEFHQTLQIVQGYGCTAKLLAKHSYRIY